MNIEAMKRKPEAGTFSTLAEIRDFLHQRQGVFFGKFKNYGLRAGEHRGWEIVDSSPSGLITKRNNFDDVAGYIDPQRRKDAIYIKKDAKFTGNNWCNEIATAIFIALYLYRSDNIEISLGGIGTDTNSENWHDTRYTPEKRNDNHRIVRATDKRTGEVMYIDGSYGQINHILREKIVTVSQANFGQYYNNGNETPTFKEYSMHTINSYFENPASLTQAELIDIITGLIPSATPA